MILIPVLALAIGIALGTLLSGVLPDTVAPYFGVAILAGLDSICGGARSQMESKFNATIFITGFVSNILIASFLVWLGFTVSVNLILVAGFVFGARIFQNLSLIRRILITRFVDTRARRAVSDSDQPHPAPTDPNVQQSALQ